MTIGRLKSPLPENHPGDHIPDSRELTWDEYMTWKRTGQVPNRPSGSPPLVYFDEVDFSGNVKRQYYTSAMRNTYVDTANYASPNWSDAEHYAMTRASAWPELERRYVNGRWKFQIKDTYRKQDWSAPRGSQFGVPH